MKSLKNFNPIGWCHFTVNFWWGCAKVSDACKNCYAETMAERFSQGKATWGADGQRWIRTEAALKELRQYDAAAAKNQTRYRIFINSMSDVFEDRRDLDAPRAALFAIAPTLKNLDLLLLTKRPEQAKHLLPEAWKRPNFPANIWIGTTIENQDQMQLRGAHLYAIAALFSPQVIFISAEPLLEEINLKLMNVYRDSLWVICGGESGPHARPMHPAWARSLRDQCQKLGVPFYFKQWGEWLPGTQYEASHHAKDPGIESRYRKIELDDDDLFRVGREAAGRSLDGVEHNEFPSTQH